MIACYFLCAQQLYIPFRLFFFFFLFFLVRPWSVVCRIVEAVGGSGGPKEAPKPNQNLKSIPNSMQNPGSVRGGHCNVNEDTAMPTVDVAVSAVFCKILS